MINLFFVFIGSIKNLQVSFCGIRCTDLLKIIFSHYVMMMKFLCNRYCNNIKLLIV